VEHEVLCQQLEELVKKHATGGIDFAEAVGKSTSHHIRTGWSESSYVRVDLPNVEGYILLGSLMEALKELGSLESPILFRDPGRSHLELQGKVGNRRYTIDLITEDRTWPRLEFFTLKVEYPPEKPRIVVLSRRRG
jgi:hypothetical protein